jgi:hypothetical protein
MSLGESEMTVEHPVRPFGWGRVGLSVDGFRLTLLPCAGGTPVGLRTPACFGCGLVWVVCYLRVGM